MRASPETEFQHEAFFYGNDADYLDGLIPFVRAGVDAGEPVLVALPSHRLDLLRSHLGPVDPALVSFAVMEDIGRNPARIIPAWADFIAPHVESGRPARGIGEPIWSGRSSDELTECERHESLLNLAFAEATGFTLLCPYDLATLDQAVIDEAHRNHPHVSHRGATAPSGTFVADVPATIDTELSAVPPTAAVLHFDLPGLGQARRTVSALAAGSGIDPARVDDLTLAVSEAMTNAVLHGNGAGRVSLWVDDSRVVCEIYDGGRITDPLAGRTRPNERQANGRGLWLMNRLCDLVQIRSVEHGQVIRLHIAR